jgi:hypothetical protein
VPVSYLHLLKSFEREIRGARTTPENEMLDGPAEGC